MQNIIYINESNDITHLDLYRSISETKLMRFFEPEPGLFIAESAKVITRALDAGYEPLSFLMEARQLTGEGAALVGRCQDVPVYVAKDAQELRRIVGYPMTRGVLCTMRRKRMPDARDVLADARRVVVLGDVENPTNVGAIIRSAAALGADAVLLTGGCGDPLYRRAIRVSMGTVFQVPWGWITRPQTSEKGKTWKIPAGREAVEFLKSFGFATAAMALKTDSVDIDDPKLMAEERLAILLGEEGEGLPQDAIDACDYTVCIPMAHGVDSLNVAAAGAVAIWQLCRHPR